MILYFGGGGRGFESPLVHLLGLVYCMLTGCARQRTQSKSVKLASCLFDVAQFNRKIDAFAWVEFWRSH